MLERIFAYCGLVRDFLTLPLPNSDIARCSVHFAFVP
jgi:hypothetical protein